MAKKRNPSAPLESSSEEEEQLKEEESEEEEVEEEQDDVEKEEQEEEEGEEEEEEEEEEEDEEENEDEEDEEEKDESSKREAIRKLLEPFGKDQLIDLLKEAALKNPSVIQKISAAAESDTVHRKIFIYGLGWDATTEILTAAFRQYGEIEECNVVVDRTTGKSKGFGFVLFHTRAGAQKALKQPQKKIGNRTTSCQLASFGSVPDAAGRKIYVTNVGVDVNPERLRAFFAKFGEIEEGPLGYDQATGKLRGFALFTYKTSEGCKKALEEPVKVFEGCQLNCRRAVEGLKSKTVGVMGGAGTGALLQPNDLALTYASASLMGLNPAAGLVGQNMNPSAALAGQSPGVGGLNPSMTSAGFLPAASRSSGATLPPYGAGYGFGAGGSGVNSISPSVIRSYDSQAALQGLGAYQSTQLSSTAGMWSQSGIGSIGTSLPPYLR